MKSLRKPYKKPIDLTLESDSKKEIIEGINKSGLAIVQNQPTGLFYTKGRRPVMCGKAGNADTKGIARGGFYVEVEVKLPGEEQSEEQKARQKEVEAWGGIYLLAVSLKEALANLRLELVKRKVLAY